jgi:hypothetical protein
MVRSKVKGQRSKVAVAQTNAWVFMIRIEISNL